jgi:RimJ/RimL family protein N-acetyltransferase
MVPREVETDRLLLRQWRDEDVELLHEIYEQPEFLETMPAKRLEETRAQLDWLRSAWDDDGYCQWAACERATNRLIGRVGLQRHRDWPLSERPVPEVGWVLHRDWWGRGLATEGGQAGVDAWREHLPDEPRLYSFTTPGNHRSLAVMRRLGLAEGGRGVRWHGYEMVWSFLDR